MIDHKLEKIIFAVILVALYIIVLGVTTQIKTYDLPINKGLSPDEVIKKELPVVAENVDVNYSYKIIGNSIFVLVDSGMGASNLYVGFKNPNSGFMFNIPGKCFYWRPNFFLKCLKAPDESLIWLTVKRVVSDYVIEMDIIDDNYFDSSKEKSKVVYLDNDGRQLEKIEHNGIKGTYWVKVVENIQEDFEIIAQYEDKKIRILKAETIKEYIGGK